MSEPSGFLHIKDLATLEGLNILARAKNVTKRYGISTGFNRLDNYLRGGGLLPGLTYILGGRPGMGKTYFLLNLAVNIARQDKPIAIFSLELSKERVLERLAYMISGIDFLGHWQAQKDMSNEQLDKLTSSIKELQELPIYIRDSVRIGAKEIKRALEIEAAQGIKVFMVDYLHIMGNDKNIWVREREIGTTIEALRDHAKTLNMIGIVASQLNRAVEDHAPFVPSLANFRDSGAIEQVAFCVLALYRKDYYMQAKMFQPEDEGANYGPDGEPILDGKLDVLILKNQEGGTGIAKLQFEGNTGIISDG